MNSYTITFKEISVVVLIALAIGGYLGYYFTSSHYNAEIAEDDKRKNTAICRLELRDGNKNHTDKRYAALYEFRSGEEEFCEEHVPTGYLPKDTDGAGFDWLDSEEDYSP